MSDTDAEITAVDAVDLSQSSLLQNLVRDTLKEDNLLASVVKRHSREENDVKQSSFTSDTAASDKNPLEDKTFLKDLSLAVARVLVLNEEFIKLINEKVYEKIATLEKQVEQQCQYTRRNCLIIHGIHEVSGENTNEIIKNFFWDKLGIEVYDSDIDRTHRLKQKSSQNDEKPRSIIVKLVSHDLKNFIYFNKKKLKGTVFLITESLTASRLRCLKILEELRKQKNILLDIRRKHHIHERKF